ncbi:unnamed protein product, partial [Protopolystoma xenopodis]
SDVVCLLGGIESITRCSVSSVTCISLSATSKWQSWKVAELPKPLACASALVIEGGNILLTGGFLDEEASSSTYFLDSSTLRWSSGPDMNIGRHGFGMCKVGQRVFVFGGHKKRSRKLHEGWKIMPQRLQIGRYHPAAESYKTFIYAISGMAEKRLEDSVERLDVSDMRLGWQFVAKILTP